MTLDPDFGLLLAVLLAALFAIASWHKFTQPAQFEGVLGAYRILPAGLVPVVSRLVPLVELLVAAGLLIPASRAVASVLMAAVLLAYATGIAVNLRRGRVDLDCGCAGPNDRRPIAPWMLARNGLLALAALAAGLPWTARPLALVDALTVAGGAATVVFLYLSAERLLGQIIPRGNALRRSS